MAVRFFFQAEDGIRDLTVTGVQTCALPISISRAAARVPGLEREVTRLEDENGRVQQLAAALNRAEANYQELRQLLGVKAPPEKLAPTADLPRATAVRARAPAGPPRAGTEIGRASCRERV